MLPETLVDGSISWIGVSCPATNASVTLFCVSTTADAAMPALSVPTATPAAKSRSVSVVAASMVMPRPPNPLPAGSKMPAPPPSAETVASSPMYAWTWRPMLTFATESPTPESPPPAPPATTMTVACSTAPR